MLCVVKNSSAAASRSLGESSSRSDTDRSCWAALSKKAPQRDESYASQALGADSMKDRSFGGSLRTCDAGQIAEVLSTGVAKRSTEPLHER